MYQSFLPQIPELTSTFILIGKLMPYPRLHGKSNMPRLLVSVYIYFNTSFIKFYLPDTLVRRRGFFCWVLYVIRTAYQLLFPKYSSKINKQRKRNRGVKPTGSKNITDMCVIPTLEITINTL